MSKAVNTNDPKYSKLTIGVCPDQWGVWFPEDPKQMDPRQAWEEMAEAGFEVIETGPFGYFPTDPKELQKWCDEFGMRVVAGTGWGILHKQEAWETTLKTFRAIAETHAAVGAEYIVHLPPLYRDDKTWEWTDDRVLSDDAWKLYVEHANALGQMLLDEYGLKMVLHPHGDSHIENREQIDRFFAETDPEYVSFCLDTGHLEYGEVDTVDLIRSYPDRIGLVHIKQMDPEVVQRVRRENLSFGEAVSLGVCVTPDAGQPKVGAVIDALAALDKELYVIVEQDLYPCAPDVPLPLAIETRRVLADNHLGIH